MYVSGQLPFYDNGELMSHGHLGGEIDIEAGRHCARRCALHLLIELKEAVGSLDRIESVLKLPVYVASEPSFAEQHLVADGASELLLAAFGPTRPHARSALGVAALPFGSPVELDAIVCQTKRRC